MRVWDRGVGSWWLVGCRGYAFVRIYRSFIALFVSELCIQEAVYRHAVLRVLCMVLTYMRIFVYVRISCVCVCSYSCVYRVRMLIRVRAYAYVRVCVRVHAYIVFIYTRISSIALCSCHDGYRHLVQYLYLN